MNRTSVLIPPFALCATFALTVAGLVGQSGTFVTAGTGCPAPTPPALELLTVPAIGSMPTVLVESLPNDTLLAILGVGGLPATVPLAGLGAAGCALLVDGLITTLTMSVALPTASAPIVVPNQTGLIGVGLELQAVGLSSSSNALGLAFSDRATLTVGWNKSLPVVPGLVLHLDAADVGGTGVNSADGAPVTFWSDRSGNGNHASQGQQAPIFRRNGVNGRPAIDFGQSSADSLVTAVSNDFSGPSATVFLVAANPVTALVSITPPGTVSHEFLLYARTGPNVRSFHHSSAFQYLEQPHQQNVAGAFIQEAVFGQAVTDLSNVINGVASTPAPVTLGNPIAFPPSVARAVHVGRRGSTVYENGAGRIAEVIVFNRQLTAAERDLVGSYLQVKYGISGAYSGIVP
ncbi:MAG: hypothetical protein MUC36_27630 [Planctomycetes bacterium]|jgi:hypothetical protein|nr:hypothetical protein [Planctomycetota bacterium]